MKHFVPLLYFDVMFACVLLRNFQLYTDIPFLWYMYMFLQIGLILNFKLLKIIPVSQYFEDQFYWEVSFRVKLTM